SHDHRLPRPVSGGAGDCRGGPRRSLDLLVMEQQALNAQAAGEIVTGLEHEIGKVIVGQHTLIRRMLTALFAAIPFAVSRGRARTGCGHLLLEGVPGVAKTLTATTLAQAIAAKFQRVQLTPDLLPA